MDELRIGGASISDRATRNIQLNALSSPLRLEMPYDPDLSWLFSPRALVGALLNVSGGTNQAFAGLVWDFPIYGPFFGEMSLGASVHDQKLFQIYSDRPELTTRFLFRESIAMGFEINPVWRITAFVDHESNGNLGYRNLGLNHAGVMLGAKVGNPTERRPSAVSPVSAYGFSWAGFYAGLNGEWFPGR